MKKTENECVDCGLPCMGSACPYQNVVRYYCDKCEDEATLYHYDGEEICINCLLKKFQVVEGSDKW